MIRLGKHFTIKVTEYELIFDSAENPFGIIKLKENYYLPNAKFGYLSQYNNEAYMILHEGKNVSQEISLNILPSYMVKIKFLILPNNECQFGGKQLKDDTEDLICAKNEMDIKYECDVSSSEGAPLYSEVNMLTVIQY